MPVTTAKLALRTPVAADNNDTPTYMLNLATDIVSSLDFGLFSARPAASVANQGRRYYATDRDREYFNTAAGAWIPLGGAPPGSMAVFMRVTSVPTGWLLCDGTTYVGALSAYPDLWAELPTAFKSGSDFVSPDMRAAVLMGADNFVLGTAGARGNLAGLAVGAATGANTKIISNANVPSHSHDMSHNHALTNAADGAHYHEVANYDGANGLAQTPQAYNSGSTNLSCASNFAGGPRLRTYSDPGHTHANTISAVSMFTGLSGSSTAFSVVSLSQAGIVAIRT
jgi:microcystin-dependent protein